LFEVINLDFVTFVDFAF